MNTPFLTFYYDYDDSKYYELCANRLKTQIESFNGEIIVKNPQLTNSYNNNCLFKPTIILNTLQEIKKPLIWIDADSYVNNIPNILYSLNLFDIGFILREHDYKTPYSGLIYFNYNKNSLLFLNKWIEKCNIHLNNTHANTYSGGDHYELIQTYNELVELNYYIGSPEIASMTKKSTIIFQISPGGWKTENDKQK